MLTKYTFTLKYTSDFTYKKEIQAEHPIQAWYEFNEWVKGFLTDGNNGFLESVKVTA